MHQFQHASFCPATETFGDKKAVLDQNLDREIQRRLEKCRGAKMVGRSVPRRRRGHIAHHPVGPAPNGDTDLFDHLRIGHVADKDVNPIKNIRFQKVDSNKPGITSAKPDPVGRHL